MIKNKNFFVDLKDQIEEEHKLFNTHMEQSDVVTTKCDHKGRVKAVPGGLRCQCGTGWQGSQLNVLLDHFNRVV